MSEEFDFEEGDMLLVRVREHGDSGPLRGKFIAEVAGFREMDGPRSDMVQLDPPWDRISHIGLRSYQAEFEVVEDVDEVNF